jgi:hypothetical protein
MGHLWIDRSSRPMRSAAIRQQIETRTEEAFGRHVWPHLFRDCAVTELVDCVPEEIGIAPDLLGHANLHTTKKHYMHEGASSGPGGDRRPTPCGDVAGVITCLTTPDARAGLVAPASAVQRTWPASAEGVRPPRRVGLARSRQPGIAGARSSRAGALQETD